MKIKTKIVIAALTCVGIASAALAHNQGHGGGKGARAERMFERMDTDQDGRVTREDARAYAADRFARMDANNDGQITKAERRDARKAHRAERIARMDTDGDGRISKAEMSAAANDRAARRFARLDTDGDGLIAIADIAERRARYSDRHHRHGERSKIGKHGPATKARMEERILKRFSRIDKDGDGVITIETIRNR